jgi:hypothetical protein
METLLGSDATFGSVVTSCGIVLSSLPHSTVCPTLIVIFSGINVRSGVILTTTASDSWGAAGIVASTQTVPKMISVAQMQIADLSVENMCDSSGQKCFVAMPTDSKTERVNYKPDFRFRPIACAVYASPALDTTNLPVEQRFRNEGRMRWKLGEFSLAWKRFW